MSDQSDFRIVEIANTPYLKHAYPGQVSFFSTLSDAPGVPQDDGSFVPLAGIAALWHAVNDPATSLVVCRPTFYSPWHWRWLTRILFDRRTLWRLHYYSHSLGPQLLRRRIPAPLAIWDDADLPLINRSSFFLMDRCLLYFKRELPPDHWRVFMKTGHSNLPTARFRKSARYRARIEKLRPVPLGFPTPALVPFPDTSTPKSVDIFFAGSVEGSSSVRMAGLRELSALRDRGFVVEVADKPLDRAEFYRRCAQALLVWSPEGHGWDCFRHYEVAGCGSVPLINRPTIERYQPLRDGEHAIYYDVEPGELMRAAAAALADKSRLESMGQAARAHCLAHHTAEAISRYVVRTTLEAASVAFTKVEGRAPERAQPSGGDDAGVGLAAAVPMDSISLLPVRRIRR